MNGDEMINPLLSAAARAATSELVDGFPDDALRFTLVYPEPVDAPDAERRRIADLLGGDRFALRPAPADPALLYLEFPGVVREQSADLLFECAQELTDALGLEACVPAVDPTWLQADELGRDAPESVPGLIGRLCNSSAPAPADRDWALRLVRAREAWARFGTRGATIRIAQPDTGVADHRELDTAIDMNAGRDLLAGGGPPVDPLSSKMMSPGHGTATSSCVVSREAGRVTGPAPDATLVPFRCINGVILSSGAATAAAIDAARNARCDIVTMSLGGPVEFPDLRRAIKRAVDAGMIVLAAAGNCVRVVVYPAWDENVIAVGGVDQHGRPWRGSSRGDKIDIAAPAENVYVARRTTSTDADRAFVAPGQGTSFAVATVAGCAALWLAHHKVDAVRAFAAGAGVSVQELFRAAVRQTAWRPADWPSRLGAGIVDCYALLDRPLDAIDLGSIHAEHANPGEARFGGVARTPRFAAEAGFLAVDASQRERPDHAIAIETPAAPQPSTALRAEISGGLAPLAAPALLTPLVAPEVALRGLYRRAGGSVEAAGTAGLETLRESVVAGAEMLNADLAEGLEARASAARPELARLRDRVRAAGPEMLRAIGSGARAADLQLDAQFALEALVRLKDRPVLRVVDGKLPGVEGLGDWAARLPKHNREALVESVRRVGRINVIGADGKLVHIGTGSVVAQGLVMTNRHVIEAFADPLPGTGAKRDWLIRGRVSINFADSGEEPKCAFAITGVRFAGFDRIGRSADPAKLDMAILTFDTSNDHGEQAPSHPAAAAGAFMTEAPLLVVGYPARPGEAAGIDPDTRRPSEEIWERFWELFGDQYGVKYASPGEVMAPPGRLGGDPRGWAFSHDATTLGGNSGSPILGLADRGLRGLHFGGAPMRQNLAHCLASIGREMRIHDPNLFNLLGW